MSDPYRDDPNIERAASWLIIFALAIGAGTGWAVAAWFDFSRGLGVAVGAVAVYALASMMLHHYGGRSTR